MARAAIIRRMLRVCYLTANREVPDAADLADLEDAWAMALRDIPVSELYGTFQEALATHHTAFMLTTGDVIAKYEQLAAAAYQEHQADDWRRQDMLRREPVKALPAAEGAQFIGPGHAAMMQLMERIRTGRGNVACECGNPAGKDDSEWFCAKGGCDFRWPLADTLNAPYTGEPGPMAGDVAGPMPSPPAPVPELSDDLLLEVLSEKCGMNPEKCGRDLAIRFGRWLKQQIPILDWSQGTARQYWQEFLSTTQPTKAAA